MDRFQSYINSVLNGLHINKAQEAELEAEILDHLAMTKNELMKAGYSEEQAEINSIESFGEIQHIKKSFKNVFTPYRRLKSALNEKKILKESIQWTVSILGAIVISLSIRSYVFAQTEVRQVSMQNTLFEGQRLIESKVEYYFGAPKRGDIVIINTQAKKGVLNTFVLNTKEFIDIICKRDEEEKNRLIKRIIGIPGDTIDIREGKVYINDEHYDEYYAKGITYPKKTKFPIRVPEGHYFVMGDNRQYSMDSRELGLINIDRIEGKAVFRIWPLDKFGKI